MKTFMTSALVIMNIALIVMAISSGSEALFYLTIGEVVGIGLVSSLEDI